MVSLPLIRLAKWHGLPQKDLIQIALAGLLHDIGNAKVDPAILEKQYKLTAPEMEEIKHTRLSGYQILKNMFLLSMKVSNYRRFSIMKEKMVRVIHLVLKGTKFILMRRL